MKYKVKVNGLEILCDDFECETIDEPTYSCPLCGYILKSIDDHCIVNFAIVNRYS